MATRKKTGAKTQSRATTGSAADRSAARRETKGGTKRNTTKRQAPKQKVQRARRPEPERTEPNRKADAPFTNDNIVNSVRGAYEVIEKYMAEGQNIAQELSKSYSNLALDGLPDELQKLQSSWLKTSNELMSGWMDLVGSSSNRLYDTLGVENLSSNLGLGTANGSISFAIKSAKLTTVKGRLRPGGHRYEMKAGKLSNGTASIPFTVTNSVDGEVTVGINIGARQTAGEYKANLVNAVTGEILGEISINVS